MSSDAPVYSQRRYDEHMQLRVKTIIWRRLDIPGHESARVFLTKSRWSLVGTALFLHERRPCRLNYSVKCDDHWRTLAAKVDGWVGNEVVSVNISVDANHNWQLNKRKCLNLTGCIDLDLNFSPLTNTLPIRRLNLAVGQQAEVRAAWLTFPNFKLEPLAQVYRRIGTSRYHYESDGFATDLEVDAAGFVIDYPSLWHAEPLD